VHHTRRANVLELEVVVVVVVARVTHRATCTRMTAKRGRGEGGHAYMNPKMKTYPCRLSPCKRDLGVVTWRGWVNRRATRT
jgi:hypothetical protein